MKKAGNLAHRRGRNRVMSDMRAPARRTPRSLSSAVVTVLLLAACGGDGGGGLGSGDEDGDRTSTTLPSFGTTTPPTSIPKPTFAPVTPSMPAPPQGVSLLSGQDPRQSPQPAAAIDDLAQRLGIDPAAIEVVVWDAVTWSDGSIGCPQPGMGYTQALVEGVRIVLAYDGEEYSYHAAGTGVPALCELEASPGS